MKRLEDGPWLYALLGGAGAAAGIIVYELLGALL